MPLRFCAFWLRSAAVSPVFPNPCRPRPALPANHRSAGELRHPRSRPDPLLFFVFRTLELFNKSYKLIDTGRITQKSSQDVLKATYFFDATERLLVKQASRFCFDYGAVNLKIEVSVWVVRSLYLLSGQQMRSSCLSVFPSGQSFSPVSSPQDLLKIDLYLNCCQKVTKKVTKSNIFLSYFLSPLRGVFLTKNRSFIL